MYEPDLGPSFSKWSNVCYILGAWGTTDKPKVKHTFKYITESEFNFPFEIWSFLKKCKRLKNWYQILFDIVLECC